MTLFTSKTYDNTLRRFLEKIVAIKTFLHLSFCKLFQNKTVVLGKIMMLLGKGVFIIFRYYE